MAKSTATQPGTPVVSIAMEDIIADERFNARQMRKSKKEDGATEYEGVKELAGNIKENGLLQPIQVRPLTGKYEGKYGLVFGFRRHAAMTLLGYKHAPCQVAVLNDQQADIRNLAENMQREDLLPWEQAFKLRDMQTKYKMTSEELAKPILKSKSHVGNLLRIVNNVHPKILEAWKGGNPGTDTPFLLTLASMENKQEQLDAWAEKTAKKVPGEESEEKEKSTPRPNVSKLKACLAAVKASDKPSEWKDGAVAALNFAIGIRKTVVGVYDPSKPEKDEDDSDSAE